MTRPQTALRGALVTIENKIVRLKRTISAKTDRDLPCPDDEVILAELKARAKALRAELEQHEAAA